MIAVGPHPSLSLGAFVTWFPAPLHDLPSPEWLVALLAPAASAPLASGDDVRAAIRDLLRHGGYKPTGRGKPASEYLLRVAAEGALAPINLAVDACNAASLHSGLPISVVDRDLVKEPLRVDVAPAGARYVFNPSGQEIDLDGLLALFDAEGPCGGPVKDAQRTKTSGTTRRTLSLVWGTRALGDRTARATEWYRDILHRAGARTEPVET